MLPFVTRTLDLGIDARHANQYHTQAAMLKDVSHLFESSCLQTVRLINHQ